MKLFIPLRASICTLNPEFGVNYLKIVDFKAKKSQRALKAPAPYLFLNSVLGFCQIISATSNIFWELVSGIHHYFHVRRIHKLYIDNHQTFQTKTTFDITGSQHCGSRSLHMQWTYLNYSPYLPITSPKLIYKLTEIVRQWLVFLKHDIDWAKNTKLNTYIHYITLHYIKLH